MNQNNTLAGYFNGYMHKEAGKYSDALLSLVPGIALAPLKNPVIDAMTTGSAEAGTNLAQIGGHLSNSTVKKGDYSNPAWSLLPGVASYRQGIMAGASANDYKKRTGKRSNRLSEILGQASGAVIGGGVGGVVGHMISPDGITLNVADVPGLKALAGMSGETAKAPNIKIPGAAVGALTGIAIPAAAAALLALATKTRTTEEQDEAESTDTAVANYLIPGVANYNNAKRIGHGYSKFQEGSVK